MKKRGDIPLFNLFLTLATIIVLSMLFIAYMTKQNRLSEIGTEQLKLFNMYEKGELASFYIEQSALFASNKVYAELAEGGGYILKLADAGYTIDPPCGIYDGYAVWKSNDKDCYPSDSTLKGNFFLSFQSYFDAFLTEYAKSDAAISLHSDAYATDIYERVYVKGSGSKPVEGGCCCWTRWGYSNAKNIDECKNSPGECVYDYYCNKRVTAVTGTATKEIALYFEKQTASGPYTPGPVTEDFIWPALATPSVNYPDEGGCFGGRGSYVPENPCHRGIDIYAPEGTVILATAEGTVIEAVSGCQTGDYSCGGMYGNHVIIDHGNGLLSMYAHLSSLEVSLNNAVIKGQRIGYSGSTGFSSGAHLHFEIRQNDRYLFPLCLYPQYKNLCAPVIDEGCQRYSNLEYECPVLAIENPVTPPPGGVTPEPIPPSGPPSGSGMISGVLLKDIFNDINYPDKTKVTHYYTPYEGDCESWSEFVDEVEMEGSGITTDNRLCRYYNVAEGRGSCQVLEEDHNRGYTGSGTNPTAKRTVATDPELEFGTKLYIDYGVSDWTGCYIVEDRGSAITGNHIDLYTGVGWSEYSAAGTLPQYADVYKVTEGCDGTDEPPVDTPKEKKTSNVLYPVYILKPSFVSETNYTFFSDYMNIVKQAQKIVQDCSMAQANTRDCVSQQNNQKDQNGFTWMVGDCSGIGPSADPSINDYKFCVKTGKLIVMHDKTTGTISYNEIMYRFALHIENLPPEKVVLIGAESPDKTEGTLRISWIESTASDLDHYHIYYSKNPFGEILPSISFKEAQKGTATVDLSGLDNNVPYYIAVVAVDLSSSESSFELKMATPIDRLSPAAILILTARKLDAGNVQLEWSRPGSNEDGSINTDLEGFGIYYEELPFDGVIVDRKKYSISISGASCSSSFCSYSFEVNNIDNQYFGVTPIDNVGNENLKNVISVKAS